MQLHLAVKCRVMKSLQDRACFSMKSDLSLKIQFLYYHNSFENAIVVASIINTFINFLSQLNSPKRYGCWTYFRLYFHIKRKLYTFMNFSYFYQCCCEPMKQPIYVEFDCEKAIELSHKKNEWYSCLSFLSSRCVYEHH